jgi:hypothetical protein
VEAHLQHIHQEGNNYEHLLAKAGINSREAFVLYSNPPNFVISLLLADAWGIFLLQIILYLIIF